MVDYQSIVDELRKVIDVRNGFIDKKALADITLHGLETGTPLGDYLDKQVEWLVEKYKPYLPNPVSENAREIEELVKTIALIYYASGILSGKAQAKESQTLSDRLYHK